jgi:cytochrome b involved in lipid metabolism
MLGSTSSTDAEQYTHSLTDSLQDYALPVIVAILLGIALLLALQLGTRKQPQIKAERSTRCYTAEDVGRHNKAEDVWIILKGKVYDVTPYVNEHPGGAAILRNAGGDSTKGFYAPQHPDRVFDLIDDFYVGDLVES